MNFRSTFWAAGTQHLFILGLLFGNPAAADESAGAELHIIALSEATDWCAADIGVPVVVRLEGLEVFEPVPKTARPKSVTVRRGTDIKRVDVSRLTPGQSRTRIGTNAMTFDTTRIRSFEEARREMISTLKSLGSMTLKIRSCSDLFSLGLGNADWVLHDATGRDYRTGSGRIRLGPSGPLIGSDGFTSIITIGDDSFAIRDFKISNRTFNAFVSPTEELRQ